MSTLTDELLKIIRDAALSWLTEEILSGVTNEISNLAVTSVKDKGKSENAISIYTSTLDSLNINMQKAQELADRYFILSDGVGTLGECLSLTRDEYLEFNSIANEIAAMFPTLIQGYTAEGTAILNLKSNTEALKDAYVAAQEEAHNLLIMNGKDILQDYDSQLHGKTDYSYPETPPLLEALGIRKVRKLNSDEPGPKDIVDVLTRLTGTYSQEEFDNTFKQIYSEYFRYSDNDKFEYVLKESGFQDLRFRFNEDDFSAAKKAAVSLINTYQKEIDQALTAPRTLANAYLSENETYKSIDSELKPYASILVNTMDSEIFESFQKNPEELEAYIEKIANQVKNNKSIASAFQNLFRLDLSELPVKASMQAVYDNILQIAEAMEEDPVSLMVRLGYDEFKIGGEADNLLFHVKELLQDEFDSQAASLSLNDLRLANEMEIEPGTLLTWDELLAKIEETRASLNTPFSYSSMTAAQSQVIDTFTNSISRLSSYLDQVEKGADSNTLNQLFQEFPELENQTSNLSEAIQKLIYEGLDKLYVSLGQPVPDNYKALFQDMADSAAHLSYSLSDAFDSLKKSSGVMDAFQREMLSGFTEGTLSSVGALSSSLNDMVALFYSDLISADDLYQALNSHYQNDVSNYKQALLTKNQFNESFYQSLGLTDAAVINSFKKNYGVDISNCKNYAQAKFKIEQELLTSVSDIWSKYYDVQTDTFTEQFNNMGLSLSHYDEDSEAYSLAYEKYKRVENTVNKYRNAMNALNDITFTGIDTNFDFQPSSGSSMSKFSEEIDFTQYKLEELDKEIEKLRSKADSIVETGLKNHIIDQILYAEQQKKDALLDTLELYQKKANALLESIPASYRDMAKNGSIAIETFVGASNEKVVSAIKEYRSMAGSVSDVTEKLSELGSAMQSLKLEKFNNLKSDYSNQFNILSSFVDQFREQIDLLESQGYTISEKLYGQMMEKTGWQIEMLKNEREALVRQMSDIIKSTPDLSKDNFYEMANAITSIDSQITGCISSLEEFNNAVRDIPWNNFDRVIKGLSSLDSELSGLENLLGSYDLTIDGEFSDYGLAQLGILTQQYELARYQTEQYTDAIETLDQEYQSGKWSALEYSEKLQELVSAQWNSVGAAASAKNAIIELAKSRVNAEISSIDKAIDAYEELINAQVKELKAEKELHDFRKSINDQQSTITSLEKQLAAITNDTSNAAAAKQAQLEEQLKLAREELDEMYYEQGIKEKEDALNEELLRYQKLQEEKKKELEESLEDENKLVTDYIDLANANASTIADILEELAKEHGIKLSDCIINPWKSGENAISDYAGSLKQASGSFRLGLDSIKGDILSLTESADLAAQSFIEMFNINTSAFLKDLQNIAGILDLISQAADHTVQNNGEWRFDKDKYNAAKGSYGSWWYEHDDGGYTKNGWEKIDGKWYHFDKDGWMQTGWYQDEKGDWYYLSDGSIGKEGQMLTDTTTPDGYYVDSSGKWSQSAGTTSNSQGSGSSSGQGSSSYGNISEVSGILRFGGADENGIKSLQYALKQLGYDLEPDGRFGAKTLAAVKSFQEKSNLSPDGIVGPETKKAFANAGFSAGGVVSQILNENQDDGIATVKRGETVLTQDFTQVLPTALGTMKSFIRYQENPFVPGQIQSISNDTYTIDNKVIVQGSVSTENMDKIISVMDKRVDAGFKKAYEKKYLKGRAFL